MDILCKLVNVTFLSTRQKLKKKIKDLDGNCQDVLDDKIANVSELKLEVQYLIVLMISERYTYDVKCETDDNKQHIKCGYLPHIW